MIDMIKCSDYIYISDNEDFISSKISSSIPLGLDCLCTLIMPAKMNEYYNFNSVITYSDKIVLRAPDYEKVNNDLENMVKNRDSIFYKYIKNMNTAVICEPRKMDIVPRIITQYKKILGNEWYFVFYCGKGLLSYWRLLLGEDIDIRELNETNFTPNEYSDFFKSEKLWNSLSGEYVLVFQSDTWIQYDETFNIDYFTNMNKSYIGGNMSYHWNELIRENITFNYYNFNGGLSLRKRKDMLQIIKHFPPKNTVNNSSELATDAEDVYFTIGCYKLGFPVGEDEESSHFGLHTIYKDKWFGIHKPDSYLTKILKEKRPDIADLYF